MKIKKSRLLIIYITLIVLLSFSYPFKSYIRIISVVGIAFVLIAKNISVRVNVKNSYIYCYILFAIWGTASYLWAMNTQGLKDQLFNMIIAVLANVIVVIFITSRNESIDEVLQWLLPVMAIYLIEALFVGHFNAEGRFSANGAVNQFGISTSYIYLITLYGAKRKKIPKTCAFFLIALAAGLTIFTGSRKALVNLLLFTCMVLMFESYNKNVLKNLAKIIGVLAVIGLIIIIILHNDALYNVLGRRIVSLFAYFNGDVEEDLSALRRAYMKADAVELFLQHPIFGIGLNNFKYVARYGTYAHSDLYEILCCLGIVGEALYFLPIISCTICSFLHWKNKIDASIIPFAIFLSVAINEFSNISYIYSIIHVFMGIAAGLMFVNHRKYKLNKVQHINMNNI